MALTTIIKGNKTADGDLTANSFITSGGASTDFVKGDGSLDSTTYGFVVELIDLSDVTSATPTDKFVLIANGSNFLSRALVTDDISDWATTIEAYIDDATAEALLEGTGNWDIDGAYTGTAITGTFQGQKHLDAAYFFEAFDDNSWLRLPRG